MIEQPRKRGRPKKNKPEKLPLFRPDQKVEVRGPGTGIEGVRAYLAEKRNKKINN